MRKKILALAALAVMLLQVVGSSAHESGPGGGSFVAYARDPQGRPIAIFSTANRLSVEKRDVSEEEYQEGIASGGDIVPPPPSFRTSKYSSSIIKAMMSARQSSSRALATRTSSVKIPKPAGAARNTGFAKSSSALVASSNARSASTQRTYDTMGNQTVSSPSLGNASTQQDEINAACRGDWIGESPWRWHGTMHMNPYGQNGARTQVEINIRVRILYCSITWRYELMAYLAQEGEDPYQSDDLYGYILNDHGDFVDALWMGQFCCDREGHTGDEASGEYDYASYGYPHNLVVGIQSVWYATFDGPNDSGSYTQQIANWYWPCCVSGWDGETWHTD